MITVKYGKTELSRTVELEDLRFGTMFLANTEYDEKGTRTLYFVSGWMEDSQKNVYSFSRNTHSNRGPFRMYEKVAVEITIKKLD